MSKESLPDRPKIYVTPKGGLYVKAEELLRSKRAQAIIEKMAELSPRMKGFNVSQESHSEKSE